MLAQDINKILQGKADEVFSFQMNQILTIQNKFYSLLRQISIGLVIFIIVYQGIIREHCFAFKTSQKGSSLVFFSGSGNSFYEGQPGPIWDSIDITKSGHEQESIFIATQQNIDLFQQRGICQDSSKKCSKDSQCLINEGEECDSGYCRGYNWCTAGDSITQTFNLSDSYLIFVQSHINFMTIDHKKYFSTLLDYMPQLEQNTFSIRDLIEKMDTEVPVNKALESGMMIKVNIEWYCMFWTISCYPILKIKKMDNYNQYSPVGYYEISYTYFKKDGMQQRHKFNQTGLKVFIDSHGQGETISVEYVLIIVSVLGCLWILPNKVIDLWLIYFSLEQQTVRNFMFVEMSVGKKKETTDNKNQIQFAKEDAQYNQDDDNDDGGKNKADDNKNPVAQYIDEQDFLQITDSENQKSHDSLLDEDDDDDLNDDDDDDDD